MPEERRRLGRRAQLLAATSVTYNVVEAVVAITAGLVAGSVALVGFGLDSIVEVSSGLIILWQFRHPLPESRERLALRMLAVSFFALAGYVSFESVRALVAANRPDASPVGIALAIASLIVMPVLSWAQRRTGRALGSNAVVADGTQTLLCTYLSAVLLVGLVLDADPGLVLGGSCSRAWSSLLWRSVRGSRHGAARAAAHPPDRPLRRYGRWLCVWRGLLRNRGAGRRTHSRPVPLITGRTWPAVGGSRVSAANHV